MAIGYLLGGQGQFFYIFMIGFAVVLVLIQYLIGPKTVEWSMKVKYVSESEYPKLHQMVQELSKKAELPKKPKVAVSSLDLPNAFAYGRSQQDARVCVTKGILKLLSDEELKAVLGHEISHVKHRDMAVITILSVVPMICYMIYISFFWGGMFGGRQRNAGAMIAIGLLALVVYFITNLLVMYGSRIREYYADKGSTQVGSQPHHLATALYKLSLSSAKMSRKKLKQAEGMKAFFLNDPSQARNEIKGIKDIDVDMNGKIDQNELMMLSRKKVKLGKSDRIMETLSTHPNMVKRIKHLSEL
ncbi:MAG: zinc metalloprotease HtpX [Candidatus Thermoplasmatota archaeon]